MKLSLLIIAMVFASINAQVQAADGPKEATDRTREANAAVLKALPFSNAQDFEDAGRGFIATIPNAAVKLPDGRPAWDLSTYDFIKGNAPDTVNPSLWRISRLNMNHGLFKVVDRVYQVRGFDLSNLTIIEGDTGLIVIDTLVTAEMAKAALDLYWAHRPKKPVVAIIYTHSHVDHYGGARGVVNEADVKSGKVRIIAPEGFLQEAVAENVYAGNAMTRRSLYQYGAVLPRNARGQIDAGLGKTTSFGSVGLIAPTDLIGKTGEKRTIDGVQMEFQMAPDTEAPAEFLIWFPQFKLLNAAEDATHTLHNLYTLRGAKVRDADEWWKTLHTAIARYGDQVEAVIAQHHWPMWGRERIVAYLSNQRDQFKYIHDQSLNLANHGLTPNELAEQIRVPEANARHWYNRGYYGSVNHNAKAVYQRYLGWYDSNPANLHPLPPSEVGRKYVESMGGADNALKMARASYDKGEYRWVAEQLKHLVFADPRNQAARDLQADAFEQMGYQTENPTWRNEYLMGAYELRQGVPDVPPISTVTPDVLNAMSEELILGYAGIRLNGPKADGKAMRVNWVQPSGRKYALELRNSVLLYTADTQFPDADVTLTADKLTFASMMVSGQSLDKARSAGAGISGHGDRLVELMSMLDNFPGMFNIIEP